MTVAISTGGFIVNTVDLTIRLGAEWFPSVFSSACDAAGINAIDNTNTGNHLRSLDDSFVRIILFILSTVSRKKYRFVHNHAPKHEHDQLSRSKISTGSSRINVYGSTGFNARLNSPRRLQPSNIDKREASSIISSPEGNGAFWSRNHARISLITTSPCKSRDNMW